MAGPGELGQLLRGLELAVRLGDLPRTHERRDDALVRHVEEHRRDADDERDGVEVPDLQGAEHPQDREGRERHRPHGVGPDHDVALAHPVDPDARGQADQQERGESRGVEHADLERGGVEEDTASTGMPSIEICAPNWLKRLTAPEGQEVAVVPQGALGGGASCRGRGASPRRPAGSSASASRIP